MRTLEFRKRISRKGRIMTTGGRSAALESLAFISLLFCCVPHFSPSSNQSNLLPSSVLSNNNVEAAEGAALMSFYYDRELNVPLDGREVGLIVRTICKSKHSFPRIPGLISGFSESDVQFSPPLLCFWPPTHPRWELGEPGRTSSISISAISIFVM